VFIDCGPIGLAGRGGHGHNDALSFEAWLEGVPLIIDCGSYVYTASFEARNRFRSTASHNTPSIDNEEINRFIDRDNLWGLHNDARPVCLEWRVNDSEVVFVGTHQGYGRLGIQVRRTIRFDKTDRSLEITDELNGKAEHEVTIPLHLAPGVDVDATTDGWTLWSEGRAFHVTPRSALGWNAHNEPCLVSPSYGVALPAQRLMWRRRDSLPATLSVTIRLAVPEP
jgi:uncharacterized heparinase superfamily protein